MIIGERLKGILKFHGITAKKFAEMTGVSEAMIYKYYKMENIGSDVIKKWAETLYIPIITFLDDKAYENTIHISSKINNHNDIEGNISISKNIHTSGVPYYNVDFIGGLDLTDNNQNIEPEYLIDFKKYNESTCWCNVSGHSMEPEINHGDIIALKKMNDISFIPLGEIYAIVTTSGIRTIKRIGKGSDEDHYSLIPTNKSPEYATQEIPKKIILHLFQVVGCMKAL